MRILFMALWLLLSTVSAVAQVSFAVTLPGVTLGIDVPTYPQLVRVPGYPVYYAPALRSNFFFYDGMYWVYQEDDWYASSWYNGPWGRVAPEAVPLYVLRIPVRYYRSPPPYFRGWQPSSAPHWGEHWGRDWEGRRSGWDRWDRRAAPAPAPLPIYQRQYSGTRYPSAAQQPVLRTHNYRYQPRDEIVRQHYREQAVHEVPAHAREQRERPAANEPARQQRPAQARGRQHEDKDRDMGEERGGRGHADKR